MALFVLGAVADFVRRTSKRMFCGKPKSTAYYQLDIERGDGFHAAATTSVEDISMLPGAWGTSKVWDDLRRDQATLQREREAFDAEKVAWRIEHSRLEAQKRNIDLEQQKFSLERQRFQDDKKESEETMKELEGIIRGLVTKSKRSTIFIEELRARVDQTQCRSIRFGMPTPPASPRSEASAPTSYPRTNKQRTQDATRALAMA